MASSVSMSKFAPRATGVRKPTDTAKRNGMFHNPPRFQYFGGVQQGFSQAGTKGPDCKAASGQNAVGPISDRGRGRG